MKKPDKQQVDMFLADILEICKKHNLSLGHEDQHGSFVIVPYQEIYNTWLFEASAQDLDWKE